MSSEGAAAPTYPPGPLPPKEEVLTAMRGIFERISPRDLTMKMLRAQLAEIFVRDMKEHTPTLSTYVNELLTEHRA